MDPQGTIEDLAKRLAEHEGCSAALITLVCKGQMLKNSSDLQSLADKQGADGKIVVVYLVRKSAAVAKATATAAAATPAVGTAALVEATSVAAGVVVASGPAPEPVEAKSSTGTSGTRVLLLIRHGQCCHDHEHDELKGLTTHGHAQAEETAQFVAQLFVAGAFPQQCALLHSTSRRARETAAKLPKHKPGLEVWHGDLLRETDPTKNPLRAEEVFVRLFAAPPESASDTLVIVAHNNIILYLLMRAAGVPIETATQAWRLFHLPHASLTRVDVASSGAKSIFCIGAAGHISHSHTTWNNIQGADMSAWKGGGPERHKFSGRMVILVRQGSSNAERADAQADAVAKHITALKDYMVSSHMVVTCTTSFAAQQTANAVARKFHVMPKLLPDSVAEHPEGAFLQFFSSPEDRSRDTVVMVAEDKTVLYWLLRALQMSPQESKAATSAYCIGHASITLVNVKSDRSIKVVAVGDTGHLPLACV